jgi:hypothetical protein
MCCIAQAGLEDQQYTQVRMRRAQSASHHCEHATLVGTRERTASTSSALSRTSSHSDSSSNQLLRAAHPYTTTPKRCPQTHSASNTEKSQRVFRNPDTVAPHEGGLVGSHSPQSTDKGDLHFATFSIFSLSSPLTCLPTRTQARLSPREVAASEAQSTHSTVRMAVLLQPSMRSRTRRHSWPTARLGNSVRQAKAVQTAADFTCERDRHVGKGVWIHSPPAKGRSCRHRPCQTLR